MADRFTKLCDRCKAETEDPKRDGWILVKAARTDGTPFAIGAHVHGIDLCLQCREALAAWMKQ